MADILLLLRPALIVLDGCELVEKALPEQPAALSQFVARMLPRHTGRKQPFFIGSSGV